MKRIIILLLLILLLLPFAGTGNLLAISNTATTLSLPNIEAVPGSIVTVPITASDLDGITGCDFSISFNYSILTPLDVSLTSFTSSFLIEKKLSSNGLIKISMASSNGITDSSHNGGVIVNIRFAVSSNAHVSDTSYLNFGIAKIYNESAETISSISHNGSVKVNANSYVMISLPNVEAMPNSTVTVPIKVSNLDKISGGDFTVSFNSSILTPLGVSLESPSSHFLIQSNLSQSGIVKVSMASLTPINDSAHTGGALISITFSVSQDARINSTSFLSFGTAAIYNENAEVIPSKIQNGSVKVNVPSAPLIYIPDIQAAPNSTITIPISSTNLNGITGCDFVVTFDSNLLTPIEVKTASKTSNFFEESNLSKQGRVIISMASKSGIVDSSHKGGEIAEITFKVTKTAQVDNITYLNFSSAKVYNQDAEVIQSLSQRGSVRIGGTYTITASAGLGGSITPSGDVTVNYGSNQKFTIKADYGYTISRILVDGAAVRITSPFKMNYIFHKVAEDHTISAEFTEIPDTTPPTISNISGVNLSAPSPEIKTNKDTFTFTVEAHDKSGIARMVVKVNGVVQIDKDNLDPTIHLSDGVNDVEVIIYDSAGNSATVSFKVICDTKPPVINVTLPETVTSPDLTIKGKAYDQTSGTKSVTVNGKPVAVTLSGYFKTTLTLSPGLNNITIEAKDKLGNVSKKTFKVTYVESSSASSSIIILKIGSPYINVNGVSKKIDAQGSKPIIKDSRTFLPIRTLIESLGGIVEWDAKERKVTINLHGHSIILWIGKITALVDGIKTKLDVAPFILNGRTYLPLRFIAEHLDSAVDWQASTQTITIYYWP
jgi:hypothetical protein